MPKGIQKELKVTIDEFERTRFRFFKKRYRKL